MRLWTKENRENFIDIIKIDGKGWRERKSWLKFPGLRKMQFINFFKELFDKAEEDCDFPDRDIIINSYQTSSPKHKLSSF